MHSTRPAHLSASKLAASLRGFLLLHCCKLVSLSKLVAVVGIAQKAKSGQNDR
jgi:hypothetical protein